MASARTDLGNRIRTARADLGWKQKHLAAEVRVEPITVSRWERGATTPDLETLRLVAGATGKPLAYFVSGEAAVPAESGAVEAIARMEDALERIEAELTRLSDAVAALGRERGGEQPGA
jgi:transcriptional regulator with XRE-family HTH domain